MIEIGLVYKTLIASGITVLAILVTTRLAVFFGLIDSPSHRKRHKTAVPTVGGLAIYFSTFMLIIIFGYREPYGWIVAAGGIVTTLGALDDALSLGVRTRFIVQVLSVVVVMDGSDLIVTSIGLSEIGELGISGVILTIFAVIGLMNSFNMSDGIDGLASGHALVSLAVLWAVIAHFHGSMSADFEGLLLFWVVCFVFWMVNLGYTPIKPIFLGDAGSLFLGFFVGWTLIYYSQSANLRIEPVAVVWVVAVPVWDSVIVMVRRIKSGRSAFHPDRTHLHHIMVDSGMSQKRALGVILSCSIAISTLGACSVYLLSPFTSLVIYCVVSLAALTAGILFKAQCEAGEYRLTPQLPTKIN